MVQRDNCVPEKYTVHSSLFTVHSFYQWDEIMNYDETISTQGLCPPGWHVPTEADWNTLFKNYTDNGFAASPLKYSGFQGLMLFSMVLVTLMKTGFSGVFDIFLVIDIPRLTESMESWDE